MQELREGWARLSKGARLTHYVEEVRYSGGPVGNMRSLCGRHTTVRLLLKQAPMLAQRCITCHKVLKEGHVRVVNRSVDRRATVKALKEEVKRSRV